MQGPGSFDDLQAEEQTRSVAEGHGGCDEFDRVRAVIATIDTRNLAQGAVVRGWRSEYFSAGHFSAEPTAYGFERKPGQDAKGATRWTAELIASETGEYRLAATRGGRARVIVGGKTVLDSDAGDAARRSERGRSFGTGTELRFCDRARTEGCGGGREFRVWMAAVFARARRVGAVGGVGARLGAVLFFTGNRLGHGRAQEGEGAAGPVLSLPLGEDEAISAVLAAPARRRDREPERCARGDAAVDRAPPLALRPWMAALRSPACSSATSIRPVGCRLPFRGGWRIFPLMRRQLWAGARRVCRGCLHRLPLARREGLGTAFPCRSRARLCAFRDRCDKGIAVEIRVGETPTVRVEVPDVGARAEVVQLYVENVAASVPRPPRELKGFAKLRLAPSETGVAELTLTSGDFVFRDEASAGWKIEPVEFVLRSGLSSRHLSPGGPVKVQAEAEGRMTIFTTGRGLVGAARWSLSFESDDFHVEAEEAARALVVRPSAPDLHAVGTLLEEVVSDTCRGP